MASRKRKPDSPQIGLTFAGPSLPPREHPVASQDAPDLVSAGPPLPAKIEAADLDLEAFDDYDDQTLHEDVPRLRLVDPPREVSIIVEAVSDGFEVCRLRDNGTTVASVMYTRKELIELVSRAQAALEM